jgi:hypothetical protein
LVAGSIPAALTSPPGDARLGEVNKSAIDVKFKTTALGDKVMFAVMDEMIRRMIFEFKKTRTAEEVTAGMKFGWIGSADDPYKFQAQVVGIHDSDEVRDMVATLDREATEKSLPVHIYYERA